MSFALSTSTWVRGEVVSRRNYARVYPVRNTSTGEMITLKEVDIPETAGSEKDSAERALKLESETLKSLDHPNIVRFLRLEESPSNLSLFLEYIPESISGSLFKHGRFEEEITKSFASQVLSGLGYLHFRGFVHRDLKCDNILLDETSGVCKISDFGLCRRANSQIDAHTIVHGVVFWMAPEMVRTQPQTGYDSKIDIWGIGCVVLEMWTATRPWHGAEAVNVMLKLFESKLAPPVPEGLVLTSLAEDFRLSCFAIDPQERPTALELQSHPYLTPRPGWIFHGLVSAPDSSAGRPS